MKPESHRNSVDAIYDLRDAVEAKVQAEHDLANNASPGARDALLAAQLDLEAKTQDAIDVCGECGHESADGHRHAPGETGSGRASNVVYVDFGRSADEA